MIPLCMPVFNKEMEEAAVQALNNEKFVGGESVDRFEEEFARYIGTKRAVSMSSGTNALHLALLVLGAKGRDVLTTPMSFIATANSVLHAEGRPVFVDIDETYNLDVDSLPERPGENTVGLLPVHLYGYPARLGEMLDYAQDNGLFLIEDTAQGHGASLNGKRLGSFGDIGCFSFYSTKNMTVGGDGGMITTDDEDLAEAIAKYRNCGRVSQNEHDVVGFTSRLNSVNAAIGRVQLRLLDQWNERRRGVARRYDEGLSSISQIRLPPSGGEGVVPSYYMYVLRVPDREELGAHLKENGIGTGVHFPLAIHTQPIYKELFGYHGGEFPNSEEHARECISIPMHSELNDEDVEAVIQSISEFYDGGSA